MEGEKATIKVVDKSSNGTYVCLFFVVCLQRWMLMHVCVCIQIAKQKVGKGMSRVLRNGDELSFGPQSELEPAEEDYRRCHPPVRE